MEEFRKCYCIVAVYLPTGEEIREGDLLYYLISNGKYLIYERKDTDTILWSFPTKEKFELYYVIDKQEERKLKLQKIAMNNDCR